LDSLEILTNHLLKTRGTDQIQADPAFTGINIENVGVWIRGIATLKNTKWDGPKIMSVIGLCSQVCESNTALVGEVLSS
jgi:hypothetical protein